MEILKFIIKSLAIILTIVYCSTGYAEDELDVSLFTVNLSKDKQMTIISVDLLVSGHPLKSIRNVNIKLDNGSFAQVGRIQSQSAAHAYFELRLMDELKDEHPLHYSLSYDDFSGNSYHQQGTLIINENMEVK